MRGFGGGWKDKRGKAPPPPHPAKKRKWFESDSDDESDKPASASSSSFSEDTLPPKSTAVLARKEKGWEKKTEGARKEAGGK